MDARAKIIFGGQYSPNNFQLQRILHGRLTDRLARLQADVINLNEVRVGTVRETVLDQLAKAEEDDLVVLIGHNQRVIKDDFEFFITRQMIFHDGSWISGLDLAQCRATTWNFSCNWRGEVSGRLGLRVTRTIDYETAVSAVEKININDTYIENIRKIQNDPPPARRDMPIKEDLTKPGEAPEPPKQPPFNFFVDANGPKTLNFTPFTAVA